MIDVALIVEGEDWSALGDIDALSRRAFTAAAKEEPAEGLVESLHASLDRVSVGQVTLQDGVRSGGVKTYGAIDSRLLKA